MYSPCSRTAHLPTMLAVGLVSSRLLRNSSCLQNVREGLCEMDEGCTSQGPLKKASPLEKNTPHNEFSLVNLVPVILMKLCHQNCAKRFQTGGERQNESETGFCYSYLIPKIHVNLIHVHHKSLLQNLSCHSAQLLQQQVW